MWTMRGLEVLLKINGKAYQIYHCRANTYTKSPEIRPKASHSRGCLYPTLIGHYDLRIFLSIHQRNRSEDFKKEWEGCLGTLYQEWIPKENLYFEKMGIREK